MRAYQTKTNLGGAADSIVTTKYGGGEISSLNKEGENAVSASGQTVANSAGVAEKFNQLAQALFINGTGAQTMQDSGIADALIVTPVTGTSGLVVPDAYANMNGAIISAIPAFVNTGATTLDFGQTTGTLLGTKKVLSLAGAALVGAEFDTTNYHEFRYDTAADAATGAWIFIGIKLFSAAATAPLFNAYGAWRNSTNSVEGSFTSGSWVARNLNEEVVDDDNIGTVAANQVTLVAGSFVYRASAPAYEVDGHIIRIEIAGAGENPGVSGWSGVGSDVQTRAEVVGQFTIGVSSAIEIQHQCETTNVSTDAMGKDLSFITQGFSIIEVWRLA